MGGIKIEASFGASTCGLMALISRIFGICTKEKMKLREAWFGGSKENVHYAGERYGIDTYPV